MSSVVKSPRLDLFDLINKVGHNKIRQRRIVNQIRYLLNGTLSTDSFWPFILTTSKDTYYSRSFVTWFKPSSMLTLNTLLTEHEIDDAAQTTLAEWILFNCY